VGELFTWEVIATQTAGVFRLLRNGGHRTAPAVQS
jgi:hypothetical protein